MTHINLNWKFHETEQAYVLLCGDRLFGILELESENKRWKVKAQSFGHSIRRPKRGDHTDQTPRHAGANEHPIEQKRAIEQNAIDFFQDCFGKDCNVFIDDGIIIRTLQNI